MPFPLSDINLTQLFLCTYLVGALSERPRAIGNRPYGHVHSYDLTFSPPIDKAKQNPHPLGMGVLLCQSTDQNTLTSVPSAVLKA